MNNFSYIGTASPEEALQALGSLAGSRVLAGGTDMVPLMKDEIVSPEALVDISRWPNASGIEATGEDLRIGALASLSSIAANPTVQREYTALADACRLAATEQLRNMGTIGGNLLQQTRCWYYRGPDHCWMKGGEWCFARRGENEHHSIFNVEPSESPCVSAHPSDPAAALLALDARVTIRSAEGEREVPVEEFFARPTASRRNYVMLPDGALVTEIVLPAPAPGTRSVYMKATERAAWAFALAGVAVSLSVEDNRVAGARVGLSGVASIPIRAHSAEERLEGSPLSEIEPEALASLLVEDATPLAHNGYKVPLLRGLFQQALEEVLAPQD